MVVSGFHSLDLRAKCTVVSLLVFAETGSRLAYLAYVTGSMLRRAWSIPGIERTYSMNATCDYLTNSTSAEARKKIYVEADGELLGSLPVEFTIVPDALTVLGPLR